MPLNCPDCDALPDGLPCFDHYRSDDDRAAIDALNDGDALAVNLPLARS